jgi:hypothetical protein
MGSKGAAYAEDAESQILHPYLDKDHFFNEQWVYARVIMGDPCVMEFYVQPPSHWSEQDKKRVERHFADLNLAHRYSIQSDDQLSILIYQRKTIMNEHSENQFREHLESIALTPNLFSNHWQKVMHQALAANEDFCKTKF